MCGICGFIDADLPGDALIPAVTAMADRIAHRGPDGAGVWTDENAGIALGHRRLAIVDLSPTGHQPMLSQDGRLVLTYNGEIYNFGELRAELKAAGHIFRGRSDTEVLVEACAAWGIERTARRLIGIFAFAVWDRRDRTLSLVRDPVGVKPLYYGWFDGKLIFGSELKALRAFPHWPVGIDRDALAAYLRLNYVPSPFTIYRGVRKLPPGSILTLRPGGEPELSVFWDLRSVARAGLADPLDLDPREAADRLESLLSDAIGRQMMADVPLGAFLSGGIDSSTVVALMQAQSERPVRTFTIGFAEAGYDEARQAKAVAEHLGTDHTELYVEPHHVLDVIPHLPDRFDEPFADASQIPTLLVSELTRRHVTVALSGDGGDELFAGYNRYVWAPRVWRRLGRIPVPLQRILARAIRSAPPGALNAVLRAAPESMLPAQPLEKLYKLADMLGQSNPDALYRRLVSQWDDPERIALGTRESTGVLWDDTVQDDFPGFVERMQFLDSATYLPDDILVKVDRASMATGLEARVPLLDHRVIEFAWRLPPALRIRDGRGKRLLRDVLYRHVPPGLVERPKMGFSVPLGPWLCGPLRDWCEHLLDRQRLTDAGLDPRKIHRKWAEHRSGHRDWGHLLWNILCYQAWSERWDTG
jgi:asparagine synthase (glutamine-hydrolysing)